MVFSPRIRAPSREDLNLYSLVSSHVRALVLEKTDNSGNLYVGLWFKSVGTEGASPGSSKSDDCFWT